MSDGEWRIIERKGVLLTEIDGTARPATEIEAYLWKDARDYQAVAKHATKEMGRLSLALSEAREPRNVECPHCGRLHGIT